MNPLDPPPCPPQVFRAEGKALVMRTQNSYVLTEMEEHHFPPQVTARPCWSVRCVETGPASLTQAHPAGFQSHLLWEASPVPPVLATPSPLKSRCVWCEPHSLPWRALPCIAPSLFSVAHAEEGAGCCQDSQLVAEGMTR